MKHRILKSALLCGALAASLALCLFSLGAFAGLTVHVFYRPDLAVLDWVQLMGALLLGFGLAWTSIDLDSLALKLGIAAAALAETAALAWALHLGGVDWPPFTALTAGAFATGLGIAYGLSPQGQRKREITTRFSDRISAATARHWIDSDEPLALKGEQRVASVLVCKTLNLRELSETLAPRDFVAFSNRLLAVGSQVLMESGGVWDAGSGAFLCGHFGAALADPAHATRACEAALRLGGALETLRQECLQEWGADPDWRIAVNSGPVIAGALGPSVGFGIWGDTVDFCHRLCEVNPFYGTRLLMGAQTLILSRGTVEARPVELLWNFEQEAWEEFYEPLALADVFSADARQRRDVFWLGVILWRSGLWEEAAAYFQALVGEGECEDPLARHYLERIALAVTGETAPSQPRLTLWPPVAE